MVLVGCSGPSEPVPTPAPVSLIDQVDEGTTRVVSAMGASIFVPTLASLDEGDCIERVRTLRRRLRTTELLYEAVPSLAHWGSFPETLPEVSKPAGEEFAAFDYDQWVAVARDGTVTGSSEWNRPEAGSVLLRADRYASGAAVRALLKTLRGLGVPYVGLLYGRPLDGFERAEASEAVQGRSAESDEAGAVFPEGCPVDWSVLDAAGLWSNMELWIETVARGLEKCDCATDPRDVVWLYEDHLNPQLTVAIPIDVHGRTGARPLVIGEGRPWGPAAKALFNAIRIDPARPRGTPVVLDLDASPQGVVPRALKEPPPP
jgi:hypothetical protein